MNNTQQFKQKDKVSFFVRETKCKGEIRRLDDFNKIATIRYFDGTYYQNINVKYGEFTHYEKPISNEIKEHFFKTGVFHWFESPRMKPKSLDDLIKEYGIYLSESDLARVKNLAAEQKQQLNIQEQVAPTNKKEYEILSFIKDGRELYLRSNGIYDSIFPNSKMEWYVDKLENLLKENVPIKSVKRLSDNFIVSIGDDIGIYEASYGNSKDSHKVEKIVETNGKIWIHTKVVMVELSVLNKREKDVLKDYEILSYANPFGTNTIVQPYKIDENSHIYSVKRLSDGEIFKLGDKVQFGSNGNHGMLQYNALPIKMFELIDDKIVVKVEGDGAKFDLNILQKHLLQTDIIEIKITKDDLSFNFYATTGFLETILNTEPFTTQIIDGKTNEKSCYKDKISEKLNLK